jgi:outer membrane protein OmpA-like peptidoglycan-associated protein
MKNMSSFKKSVLSIVILSAVTGSFISWDKYQPRQETQSMVEFYQNRGLTDKVTLLEDMGSHEMETLESIAEDQLIEEAELIAQELAESAYAPESGESYGKAFAGVLENEQFILVEESVLPTIDSIVDSTTSSEMVIGEKILFAFDSSKVADEYFPLLNETAQSMQDESLEKEKIWQVVGYADLSGNYIYNSRLAKKRAQAVTEYLVNKGVDEDQLITVSLGASQPLYSERNDENNRLERRVEIHDFEQQVAISSDQFNDHLAREITQLENRKLLESQNIQVEQQLVESDFMEKKLLGSKLVEKQLIEQMEPVKAALEIDFSQAKIQSMTTVMEF